MPLRGLLTAVAADPSLQRALEDLRTPAELAGPPGLRPLVAAALADRLATTDGHGPLLVVVATTREADETAAQLRCLLPAHRVGELPAWETLPHERLSPRADTVGRRVAVLRRLAHPTPDPRDGGAGDGTGRLDVVVTTVRALLQPLVAGLGDVEPVVLVPGLPADLSATAQRLAELGYSRVELVGRRGEMAVRGGLLDVFPPTAEHPVRVEFWGDDVDEVREFAVADQRTLRTLPGLWAPPCREVLLTDQTRRRARAAAADPQHAGPVAEALEQVADGAVPEGVEALAPLLVDRMALLTEELPAGAAVLALDPERLRTRAADLVATGEEFLAASWTTAAEGGKAPVDLSAGALRGLVEVRERTAAAGVPWWTLSPFADDAGLAAEEDAGAVVLAARPAPEHPGDPDAWTVDVRGRLDDGWAVVALAEGHGTAERIAERFRDADLPARLVEDLSAPPPAGTVTVAQGSLPDGVVSDLLKLALLTEQTLTGARSAVRAVGRQPVRRRKNAVDLVTLQPGDAVVHEQHGVGRFVEMTSRTVQGATREYLVVEYAPSKRNQPGDRLYVPSDQLDQITRYVGGEAPSLDRIGGSDWARRKGRARKAVKDIADDLVRLYAARRATQGHAFGPDTPWQRELEDAFPFVETPDQASAVDEVKADMESPVPMDRVICGDVGYGKTEIAVRAAFKAVQDGRQVAVLVPTTILANQHLQTFGERFAGFPVVVRGLSRFTPARERTETLKGLADGSVDVVIGTHRILQPSTRFQELGLVVVDEEQRFGVEHKEFLKTLRTSVDVLSMSATPIPRTLEMSLVGIREMSTILTPPEERHPVLTSVGVHDRRTVAAAVRRELSREGQVFYLHNRVETIDRAASDLVDLVPEARVAVAHGQMPEDALEDVMLAFWERRVDVLVCTTIVESGLDVANANTLVVERSDLLGLSQLHQLRGRVGRSRERAYAYFLYPPDKPLTEEAHDRLATIAQQSDLGAGMAVATKDLEIRGAGNLLGGEQAGHVAGVGFDLYVRLVGEAVSEAKGDVREETPEVRVDLPVDAHLPHDYVPSERLRLEAYRRLAAAVTDEAVDEVRAELVDRYGTPPEPVENLLAVARFRNRCRALGLREVGRAGPHLRLTPVVLRESQVMKASRLFRGTQYRAPQEVLLTPVPTDKPVGGRPLEGMALLAHVARLLDEVVDDPLPPGGATGQRAAHGTAVAA